MIPLPEPYNAHSVGQILRDPASQWSYLAIPIYTADQMRAYGAACAQAAAAKAVEGMVTIETLRLAERAAAAEMRERAIEAARARFPRAHTYASENADRYIIQDEARDAIVDAIRALKEAP